MELTNLLLERKSIREYLDKDVPDELIKKVINDGILAPSAKNKQPWNVIVVKDNDIKRKISEALYNSSEFKSPALIRTSEIIKNAPVLMLIYNTILEDNDCWYSLSIGAFIQNMLLSATDNGLGSLWIGYVNRANDEINEILNINDKRLISAVVLGYKNENPNNRPRKFIDEIVEWR